MSVEPAGAEGIRPALTMAPPRLGPPRGSAIAIGVILAELLLLAAGFALGRPLAAAFLGLAGAFFLVAFRSPETAWALVWVAFPFSMERLVPGGHAVSMPTEPMIAIALGAWALRSVALGSLRLPSSPLNLPLAALAAVALLSVALGEHRALGVKAWIVAGGYAAFGYLYLLTTPCDPARRERWVRLALATGAFWGLYGSIRVLTLGVAARTAYGAARPFFTEHGTYAAFLSMLLPLALLYTLERTGRARLGYGLAAFLIALGITFSFTRAAWVSLAVVLPATVMLWAAWRKNWRAVLLPGVLVCAIVMLVSFAGASKSVSYHARSVLSAQNASNLERLNRWMAAWEMFRDRPLFGVGYSAYGESYPEYRRKLLLTEFTYLHMGPHSELLRLLAECGIAGLLATIWFLSAATSTGVRAYRNGADPGDRLLVLGVLAGLGTYAVHGIFNSYIGFDKISVPFWTGIGVVALLDVRRAPRSRT